MPLNFLRALVFVTAGSLAASGWAVTCPDYDIQETAPSAPVVEPSRFENFGNYLLSKWYEPYHMIHDELVSEGESATIEAKFDYDKVLHKDLEGEYVSAYIYGTGMQNWESLGRYKTNRDGKVFVDVGERSVGEYIVRMVVAGDLSSAIGYLSVVEEGTEAVLFDIDGTLTLSDFEIIGDYLGIKNAEAYAYAIDTVNSYLDKNYRIIYLTARPYWVAEDTREWFDFQKIRPWHLQTNPFGDGPIPPDSESYKANYINYLKSKGVNIVRAYGNADTDISAYERSGIPKEQTYIIGKNAGDNGTQAIYGDYAYHFSTVVNATPAASCEM